MKRRALLVAALVSSALGAADSLAHAFLDHARPAVGSTVHGSPAQLKLWFTQQLEPAFSTVQVLDRSGKRVDKADAKVDASDATVLQLSLPPLAPGTYRVTWRVLSVDTHVTEGDFTFDVAP
jgi:methionine-rich copper-binding protein CopC